MAARILPGRIFHQRFKLVPNPMTMTTSSVGSTSSSSTSSTSGSVSNPSLNLNTSDFIKMMMTQLEHQDPLNPTSSDQLMSQMSQIGQLQSTSELQSAMKTLTTQSQIGSASALIGKKVTGLDINSNPIAGTVASVQVSSSGVTLALQQGGSLSLTNVTGIASPTAA